MQNPPLVSLIVATYNSQANIISCLQSIINQNYTHTEVIIVDGNSTDKTVPLITETLKNARYHNFNLVSEPDEGIYDALNKGVQRSNGDIIGFVHSDDLLASDHVISKIVSTFLNESCDGVYGNLLYVAQNDIHKTVRNWVGKPFSRKNLKYGWMPAHPTLYLSRQCYIQFGNFNTDLKIAADYDFILRIFSNQSLNFVFLNEVITKMRLGGASNKSFKNILLKMKEDLYALQHNNIGGLFSLFCKNIRKVFQFKLM